MFDGFRPAPQRPAPESTPAGEREKAAPKRGMFDGLKLSAAPLKGAERAPVPADRGQGRDYARAVERASRSAEIGRAHVELQSLMRISYAVFCLKKKSSTQHKRTTEQHNKATRHEKTTVKDHEKTC